MYVIQTHWMQLTHWVSSNAACVSQPSLVPVCCIRKVFQEELMKHGLEMKTDVKKCCAFCIVRRIAVSSLLTPAVDYWATSTQQASVLI